MLFFLMFLRSGAFLSLKGYVCVPVRNRKHRPLVCAR